MTEHPTKCDGPQTDRFGRTWANHESWRLYQFMIEDGPYAAASRSAVCGAVAQTIADRYRDPHAPGVSYEWHAGLGGASRADTAAAFVDLAGRYAGGALARMSYAIRDWFLWGAPDTAPPIMHAGRYAGDYCDARTLVAGVGSFWRVDWFGIGAIAVREALADRDEFTAQLLADDRGGAPLDAIPETPYGDIGELVACELDYVAGGLS